MTGVGSRRWRSSERIAEEVLRDMGFEVLERHHRIVVDGVEVGEVDILARSRNGELYAVEVKAGRVDVTALRQAYVNALLLGAKPMIIARGYADEAAEKLAEKLGVRVVNLSDVFLVDADELEEVVYESVSRALAELLEALSRIEALEPRYTRLLQAIAESSGLDEAAERLGVSVKELASMVAEARRKGVLPRSARSFQQLRGYARLALALLRLTSVTRRLSESVERLESILERLGA